MKHDRITSLFLGLLLAGGLLGAPCPAGAGERLRTVPGTWYLGGQLTFERDRSRTPNETFPPVETWSLEPAVGYFIHRKVALEAALQWERREVGEEKDTIKSFALGARWLLTRGPHLYLGAHVVGRWLDGTVSVDQMGGRFTMGILVPLHRRLALDFGLSMTVLHGELDFDSKTRDYISTHFTFGFLGLMGTF